MNKILIGITIFSLLGTEVGATTALDFDDYMYKDNLLNKIVFSFNRMSMAHVNLLNYSMLT